jgi:hypothetical protein
VGGGIKLTGYVADPVGRLGPLDLHILIARSDIDEPTCLLQESVEVTLAVSGKCLQ